MSALVDSHVHIVSDDHDSYPLQPAGLPGAWYREAPHTAEQLLACMDAAGVDAAVAVQGVGAYSYDNRYAAHAAARHPARLASACAVDVDGDRPLAALEHWLGDEGMDGVRFFALARPGEGPSWLTDPAHDVLWECARDRGAGAIVTILFHQLGELPRLLERFPELPVALDHCAFPPLEQPGGAAPLFELAKHRNLHCKVSTNVLDIAGKSGEPADFVAQLAEAFGPERLLWGSDFSQTHDRSYGELVAFGRAGFAKLDATARALALGGNALRLWPRLARAMGGV